MAQARTLRKSELKQLVNVTAGCSRYRQRDVTMLMFSHLFGLRVGEIASLRFDDVLDDKSNVLDEITPDLSPYKTLKLNRKSLSSLIIICLSGVQIPPPPPTRPYILT